VADLYRELVGSRVVISVVKDDGNGRPVVPPHVKLEIDGKWMNMPPEAAQYLSNRLAHAAQFARECKA
jgi:hypothetical protein